MPISKYFKGHGTEVMKNMKSQYGEKKGEQVFYATANKRKKGIPGERENNEEFKKIRDTVLNFDPKMSFQRTNLQPDQMEKEQVGQGALSKKFTSQYLMGKGAHSTHADAKPITTGDKVMSDEHKLRRAEIDGIQTHTGRMMASIRYNTLHRDEHDKALKRTTQLLHNHIRGKLAHKYMRMKHE